MAFIHDYNTFVDDYFSKCAVFLLILQTTGTKVFLFSKSNQIPNPKPTTDNPKTPKPQNI